MNHFGRIFSVSIYGESHGKEVGIIIDGVPSGIPIDENLKIIIPEVKPIQVKEIYHVPGMLTLPDMLSLGDLKIIGEEGIFREDLRLVW